MGYGRGFSLEFPLHLPIQVLFPYLHVVSPVNPSHIVGRRPKGEGGYAMECDGIPLLERRRNIYRMSTACQFTLASWEALPNASVLGEPAKGRRLSPRSS